MAFRETQNANETISHRRSKMLSSPKSQEDSCLLKNVAREIPITFSFSTFAEHQSISCHQHHSQVEKSKT